MNCYTARNPIVSAGVKNVLQDPYSSHIRGKSIAFLTQRAGQRPYTEKQMRRKIKFYIHAKSDHSLVGLLKKVVNEKKCEAGLLIEFKDIHPNLNTVKINSGEIFKELGIGQSTFFFEEKDYDFRENTDPSISLVDNKVLQFLYCAIGFYKHDDCGCFYQLSKRDFYIRENYKKGMTFILNYLDNYILESSSVQSL